jgi:hypothetical protein
VGAEADGAVITAFGALAGQDFPWSKQARTVSPSASCQETFVAYVRQAWSEERMIDGTVA